MATISKGFYFNRTDLFENIVKIQETLGVQEVPTETLLGGYGNIDITNSITSDNNIPTTSVNPTDTTSVLYRLLKLDTSIADVYLRYADKVYTDTKLLDKLSKLGDIVLGNLSLMVEPVSDNHLVNKKFVEDLINITSTNLTALEEVVTIIESTYSEISYVDASDALKVSKGGDSMSGALSLALDPISDSDAATKRYVDQVTIGIKTKPSVRVASITNIEGIYTQYNLSITGINPGVLFIDGLELVTGDKVLLINQTDKRQNGCYTIIEPGSDTTSFILHRSNLVFESTDIAGSYFFVTSGTELSATGWLLIVNDPASFVIDIDIITVTQFSGRGILLAGNGLTLNGNTFNINTASSTRLVVNADTVDLALTGVVAGTYSKLSVDAYGRVKNGYLLNRDDIPDLPWSKITSRLPVTLSGYGITDGVKITGSSMSGFLTLNANPTATLHAATKSYVDDNINTTKIYSDNKDSFIQTQVDALKIVSDVLNNDPVTKTYTDTQNSLKVNIAGDTLTGFLTLNADPQTALHASTKQYTDNSIATLKTYIDNADVVIQTELTSIHGIVNSLNTDPATKTYIDNRYSTLITYTDSKDAGLQSQLTTLQLSVSTLNTDAVTKTYVDTTKVNKTGDTLTGPLILKGNPTVLLEAANKGYIDSSLNTLKTYIDLSDTDLQGQISVLHGTVNTLNTDHVTKTYTDTQDLLKVNKAGDTISGPLYLLHTPTASNEAVTKSYVDSLNASLTTRPSVRLISTSDLNSSYDNGLNGIGAKLTSNINTSLVIDGVDVTVGDVVLIKDQLNKTENGVYTVINTGSLTAPFILERNNNFNQTQEISGSYFFVTEGSSLKGTGWLALVDNPLTFEIGVGDISITQQTGVGTITPGLGIDVTGNTISTKLENNSGLIYTNNAIDILVDSATLVKTPGGLSINPSVVSDITDRVSKTIDSVIDANVTFSATKKLKVNDIPISGTDVTNKLYVDTSDAFLQDQVNILQSNITTLNSYSVTKTYVDNQDSLKLNVSGGTLTGYLTLNGDPVSNLQAATKSYVDLIETQLNSYINTQDSTLQSQITSIQSKVNTLNTDPVTKTYVDVITSTNSTALSTSLDLKVNKTGDTLTGPLVLSGNPVSNLQAVPKQYVDTSYSNVVTNTSILLNAKLDKAGGTLTGSLILNSDPSLPLGAASKQYVDNSVSNINVSNLTGVLPNSAIPGFVGDVYSTAGSNTLTLSNTGIIASTYNNVTVDSKGRIIAGSNLVSSDIPSLDWSKIETGKPTTLSGYGINDALALSGGQMSGYIGLHANPILEMHPATKAYVDTTNLNKLNVTGGNITGELLLNSDPIVALGAATKGYVDSRISVTTPTGSILVSTNDHIVNGYLRCNGALVNTSQYTELYNILHDKFNIGNYGAGRPWCNQYNTNNLNNIPNVYWSSVSNFPISIRGHSLAVFDKSFCLVVGGMNSTTNYISSTYISKLNTNNTFSTWYTSIALPISLAYHKVVVFNNTIYVIGGNNSTTYSNVVYSSTFDITTNTITEWNLVSILPYGVSNHEVIITNNRIYVLGGNTSNTVITDSIISADIKEDGTLGTWVNSGKLPLLYKNFSVSIINSRVFLIGGNVSPNSFSSVSNVYSTDFNFNEWRAENNLPIAICKTSCFTSKNIVILLGGYTTTSVSTTYYAYINDSGNISEFVNSNANSPANRFDYDIALIGSNLYLIGGMKNDTQITNNIKYTTLQSVASNYSDAIDVVFTIPGNGQPWCYQYHLNEENTTVLNWSSAEVLSNGLFNSKVLVTNNNVYLIGGTNVLNYGNLSSVKQYAVNEDGVLNTGSNSTSLPIPLANMSVSLIKNRAYVFGGLSNATIVANVYYAIVNSNGTLGSWTVGPALPIPLHNHQTFTIGNNLYLVGGVSSLSYNNNIYVSKINSLGVLGSWIKIGTTPLGLTSFNVVITNTRIYLIGGKIDGVLTSRVYYSYINKDGSIGNWNTYIDLPTSLSYFNVVYSNKAIYIIGGYALESTTSLVMKAYINEDDSLTTWSLIGNLPKANMYSNSIILRDHIYVLGGYDGTSINNDIYVSNFKGGRNNYIYDIYPINEANYQTPCKHKHQHQFNESYIDSISTLVTDTTIPVNLKNHNLQVTSNFIYTLGGFTTTPVSSIYQSTISATGNISSFTLSSTTLPVALQKSQSALLGNKLYIFGGLNSTNTSVSTVSYNKLNSDGSLNVSWNSSSALPVALDDHDVIVTSSKIYILGGETNTVVSQLVYSANIASDNTLSNWSLSNPLPVALKAFKAILLNDYVYVIGGVNFDNQQVNTVYQAKMYNDGSIGLFSLYGYLPIALSNFDLISIHNKLFLIGGYTAPGVLSNNIYVVPVTLDNMLGSSVDTNNDIQGVYTNAITLPFSMADISSFLTNSKLYLTGTGVNTYSVKFPGGKNDYLNNPFNTSPSKFRLPDLSNTIFDVPNYNIYIKY